MGARDPVIGATAAHAFHGRAVDAAAGRGAGGPVDRTACSGDRHEHGTAPAQGPAPGRAQSAAALHRRSQRSGRNRCRKR